MILEMALKGLAAAAAVMGTHHAEESSNPEKVEDSWYEKDGVQEKLIANVN